MPFELSGVSLQGDESLGTGAAMSGYQANERYAQMGQDLQSAYQQNNAGLDSWAERFRNDYRRQSREGMQRLGGNMYSASQAGGFNPAAAMGANYAQGQAQAEVSLNNEALERQIALAQAQGQYQNLQTYQDAQNQMYGMQADSMAQALAARQAEYARRRGEASDGAAGAGKNVAAVAGNAVGIASAYTNSRGSA